MHEHDRLAERFEEHRAHLRAVAYRMLGSATEADDAVQEAWLRLGRADTSGVNNLSGWLTTVVGRVSLDMLRSRASRREAPLDALVPEQVVSSAAGADPEHEAMLADSMGPALLVILETLAPAERLAFVLHDMFAVPFEEIAPIVGRSPAAARQLASRARRRVRGTAVPDADAGRQREIVAAFLAASRDGRFDALLELLDPDVVLRADGAAVQASEARQGKGAPKLAPEIHGAVAVATTFSGNARLAQPAVIDGEAAAVFAPGGRTRVAFAFTFSAGKIIEIELIADDERLRELDVVLEDR